jgi:hypothetical protein
MTTEHNKATPKGNVTCCPHVRGPRVLDHFSFSEHAAGRWLRSGTASDNRFTARALAYIIARHFAHHETLLRERYL